MADKKRKPAPRKKPKLPDRRALEGQMYSLIGTMAGGQSTPLSQAQELIYQAFDDPSLKKQMELARQALQLSPDCADAYVVLGENAPGRKEALELFQQGMAAGERVIGTENFLAATGHFWGILETRPYMRARERLAHCLWGLGQREEAVGHLQELLRLNPNDNQGLRYVLVGWLLNLDRDADLEALLQQFPDEGSALWPYARVLLAFRKAGDQPETRKLLKAAKKANKHLVAYLLDDEPLPRDRPPHYSHGSKEEAILWTATLLPGWRATPGATTWLRAVEQAKKPIIPPPESVGPLPLALERLKKLPSQVDVWQADCRQLPDWIVIAGQKVRPWTFLVTSRSHDLVLAHDLLPELPPAARLWDKLAEAMQKPAAGKPHRPTELHVRPGTAWEELKPHLAALDIMLTTMAELDMCDFVFADMARHICGEPEPGLFDVPGMTPEMVGGFFDAAAEFYQKAPWRHVSDEGTLQVACDKFQSGPWYGVVMGQAGMTFGLALYENLKLLNKLRRGQLSDQENARQTVALTVTYGDERNLTVKDLDAVHLHGWKVASPEAYPSVFRKDRGMTMRPPLPWELQLVEGCLRAIPRFVVEHKEGTAIRANVEVPTAAGSLALTLAWVNG